MAMGGGDDGRMTLPAAPVPPSRPAPFGRDRIAFDQWVDMDIGYIGTRSIWQDIKVVLKTIGSILHKSGT